MDQFHFISDLHICEQRQDITAALLDYLREEARNTHNLYILGDLFEAWIGDDAITSLETSIAQELKNLNKHGVNIYFCHGNRDFLLGERFCDMAGMQLLEEYSFIHLFDKYTLLMHGDLLCSDDTEYLHFRKIVRDPQWQADFLAKSITERQAIARQLREHSKQANSEKNMAIMDVNEKTVLDTFTNKKVDMIIHGHTHRPQVHQYDTLQRIVLGDWETHRWLLKVNQNNLNLEQTAFINH